MNAANISKLTLLVTDALQRAFDALSRDEPTHIDYQYAAGQLLRVSMLAGQAMERAQKASYIAAERERTDDVSIDELVGAVERGELLEGLELCATCVYHNGKCIQCGAVIR